MTTVIPFTEPCIKNIQGCPALSGYIFENVFETKFCSLLESHVRNIIDLSSKNTFLTHNATFNVNGQKVSLSSNLHSAREQNVIFDLTFDSEYYYQTPDTIKDWSQYKITTTVSSIFQNALSTIQELPPVMHDINGWIIYRCHINYLANLKYLGLHYDGNPMLVKTNTIKQARMLSLTYYLHDHKEGQGGELWSVNGFVYKPKKNSAIIFPGNKVLHGVTQNVNKDPRLAFTVRMMHKDDLYLPGHPSQWLYDVSGMSI